MQYSPEQLAAHYKASGVDRQTSWSYFVRDTQLRPGMDAKDFYSIYDRIAPCFIQVERLTCEPTHYLRTKSGAIRLVQPRVQDGVVYWISKTESGSDPEAYVEALMSIESPWFKDFLDYELSRIEQFKAECNHPAVSSKMDAIKEVLLGLEGKYKG